MVKKYNISTIVCKYCGLTTTSRCGSYNGIPRYYCKSCGRKFKVDNNVYYMRSPASIIGTTLNMFYNGVGVHGIRTYLEKENNHPPSKEALYRWTVKYTLAAPDVFRDFHPSVGNLWLVSKTFFYFNNRVYKMTDVVDSATHFLIATSMTLKHDINTIKNMMNEAARKAGKYPTAVLAHMHYSYFHRIKKAFECEAEHMHNRLSALEYNVEMVEVIDTIFKPRLKIMYTFMNPETVERFINGWYVYYNFFKPQAVLGNRTPAVAAGIDCPVKSWQDLVEHLALKNQTQFEQRHVEMQYVMIPHEGSESEPCLVMR